MSSRVRKPSEGLSTKMGPMKATLPVSSLLRGSLQGGLVTTSIVSSNVALSVLSPPLRHISPEHTLCGHRSPGALNCKGGRHSNTSNCRMRRTASLDAIYTRPAFLHPLHCTFLLLDKATQTDESYLTHKQSAGGAADNSTTPLHSSSPDIKIEKLIRQRLQSRSAKLGEHSVSSQTLSPVHVKATPMLIPARPLPPTRPMRNSVEGLNQEIEKLVFFPGLPHTCRPETNLFSRGTPEGHRAPLADIFHDTRTVSSQTPVGDLLSSDESQSTSPEDGTSLTGASPRINRFLAREPPDGCEKVSLKPNDAEQKNATLFKPVGFQLRPSLGSAFQPLQPIQIATEPDDDDNEVAAASGGRYDPECEETIVVETDNN